MHYRITFEHVRVTAGAVDVEASSPDAARDIAEEMYRDNDPLIHWNPSPDSETGGVTAVEVAG